MNILLFHKTTDSELKVGMQVCYQNLQGVFNKLGTLTDFYFSDGVKLWFVNTAMGSYMADELKLIEN